MIISTQQPLVELWDADDLRSSCSACRFWSDHRCVFPGKFLLPGARAEVTDTTRSINTFSPWTCQQAASDRQQMGSDEFGHVAAYLGNIWSWFSCKPAAPKSKMKQNRIRIQIVMLCIYLNMRTIYIQNLQVQFIQNRSEVKSDGNEWRSEWAWLWRLIGQKSLWPPTVRNTWKETETPKHDRLDRVRTCGPFLKLHKQKWSRILWEKNFGVYYSFIYKYQFQTKYSYLASNEIFS